MMAEPSGKESPHRLSDNIFRDGQPLRVFNFHQPDDIMHCHDFFELVIVRKGYGYHVFEKCQYRISRGDVFLIQPGIPHTYRNVRSLEIVNILYCPERLELPLYDLTATSGYYTFFAAKPQLCGRYREKDRLTFTPEQLHRAEEIIAEMILEEQHHEEGREFFLRVALLRLIGLICRSFSDTNPAQSAELTCIGRIIRFFELNYAKKITLADTARIGGKSVSSTVRLFHDAFGYAPIEYLIRLRLEKSAARLKNSAEPIGDIAVAVGIGDSNYFAKMFHRQFGMSPRDYRKQAKKITGSAGRKTGTGT